MENPWFTMNLGETFLQKQTFGDIEQKILSEGK